MSTTTRMAYSITCEGSCVESNAGSLAEVRLLVHRLPRNAQVRVVRYDRAGRSEIRGTLVYEGPASGWRKP